MLGPVTGCRGCVRCTPCSRGRGRATVWGDLHAVTWGRDDNDPNVNTPRRGERGGKLAAVLDELTTGPWRLLIYPHPHAPPQRPVRNPGRPAPPTRSRGEVLLKTPLTGPARRREAEEGPKDEGSEDAFRADPLVVQAARLLAHAERAFCWFLVVCHRWMT